MFHLLVLRQSGYGGNKDILGPGRRQRVRQQEGDDHLQAGERLLDGAVAEWQRVPRFGLPLGPSFPKGEATDCRSVYGLRGGDCVVL